jgi:hypothetical protein
MARTKKLDEQLNEFAAHDYVNRIAKLMVIAARKSGKNPEILGESATKYAVYLFNKKGGKKA